MKTFLVTFHSRGDSKNKITREYDRPRRIDLIRELNASGFLVDKIQMTRNDAWIKFGFNY